MSSEEGRRRRRWSEGSYNFIQNARLLTRRPRIKECDAREPDKRDIL
jgi:hypothetical protein